MYLSKNLIIKFVILSSLLTFFTFSKSVADLVKPNNGIEPIQVVKIQLRGLKTNDEPYCHLYQLIFEQKVEYFFQIGRASCRERV